MSDVKVQDLSPTPFFARFLEDQFARPLTAHEMKEVRGGSDALAQDQVMPLMPYESPFDLLKNWKGSLPSPLPGFPAAGSPVTMADPSDGDTVPLPRF